MTNDKKQELKIKLTLRFMGIFKDKYMHKLYAELADACLNGKIVYVDSKRGKACAYKK